MFKIEPNAVYSYLDLMELSGFGKTTVFKWFKDENLESFNGPGGKMVTGQALLSYFQSGGGKTAIPKTPRKATNINSIHGDLSQRQVERMRKQGLKLM